MIDITQILNAGRDGQGLVAPKNELDKDAFLTLLLTQMTHQNPLEPMNNTEFLAQLAQFSSLEQMQNVSAGIEQLSKNQSLATNSQLINLIGKRVLLPGNGFTLQQEKGVDLRFQIGNDLKEVPAGLRITDGNGATVRIMDLPTLSPGSNTLFFDGKDSQGDWLKPGNYRYELISKGGRSIDTTTFSSFLVDGITYGDNGLFLKSGERVIDYTDIVEISSPLSGGQ